MTMIAGTPTSALAFGAQEACPEVVPAQQDIGDALVGALSQQFADPLTAPFFFCLKAYGGYSRFDIPARGYMSREETGSLEPEVGYIQPGTTIHAATVGTEFEIGSNWLEAGPLGSSGWIWRNNLEYAYGSTSQEWDIIDPGAGFTLGFPAPDGVSGGFLGDGTAVEDARYHNDLSWLGIQSNAELRFEENDAAHGLFAGVMYSWLELEESFSTFIPGSGIDVRYDSTIKTRAFGAHIGGRGRIDLGAPIGNWQPQLAGRAQGGIAHIHAHLDDSLSWDPNPGGIPDSSLETDARRLGAYLTVGGSISLVDVNNAGQIFLDGSYDYRPWFASAVRDGDNPSRIEFGGAHVGSIKLGYRFRF